LALMGSSNTRCFTNIAADKFRLANLGSSAVKKIHAERIKCGDLVWSGSLFPARANAQEANMSLSEYEDFVYETCKINTADPIGEWQKVEEKQQKICNMLDKKKHIRIVSVDTDISMSVAGRKWVNCCGRVNLPDGEIFTGPVEDSVNGKIRFSFPGIIEGKEVEDIRLVFKDGKVVEATAGKGEDLLHALLATDEGATYVGEIAIGTNYQINRFTRHMLFDEKIGGTVHLAVGRSLPASLGKNESLIHWDMLCDMKGCGKIYADGELIYEQGKFLI